MALSLCHVPPGVFSSFHHKQTFFIQHRRNNLRCSLDNKLRFSPYSKRHYLVSPVKSSSINGFSVEKSSVKPFDREGNVEFNERIRKWIHIIQSVLPGGSWWSFSDDIELKLMAKPVTVWRALSKMWELVSKDRWVIYAAFSALIVAALSEICIPHFLTASIFTAQSGDIAVFHRNVRLLILLCVTSGICSGLRGCCFGIANMILVKRMRETLYSALVSQDISFFDSETVGDLTSRLGSDCQQVSRVIGNDLNLILRNVLQGGGALIYLLVLSRPLGLCTLVICSTLAGVMLIYGMYQKKAAKLTQEFTASANEVAQETFSLMRTVRVYGTEKLELGRYKQWLDKLAGISLRQSAAYGFWNLSFNMLYHSTQVIAVLIGGMSILKGSITAEQLTKFILYSEWLIYSTWWVGDNLSSLMQSVGASEKVFQLMDLMPSDQFISKGKKLQRLMGQIDFINVSFYYSSRPMVPVLQNVSISVNPSEVVAIVGLSGSGKSTLVNLLLHLYEPTSGQILIDGFPLKELDIKWLRERIGYVGQEPKLFRMDISSNIKYGCTREIKQEDIEWAAKQAYAHDFISSLPNGYETLVDDDLLSGGQKQRIAIARAILRDPTILILDEATSALDAESEHNIKGVLRSMRSDKMTKRTVLVIAHRLSTIQAADRIVVMDGGRIVEMGTHGELLRKEGLYARLTRRQADAVA
ncbi:ABC transporter B family member 26, chloroplastic isoform X3 [Pistacia vera]|uniref:ABC transporter B family member 26, chloroplastic isoform X1 n=2 Tax=Pistacia vera TaxID=55513 RepID=UPI0012631F21|nr:ABC transporter B family member 26, chloroplastic isoform X1 [Pistacia vera]XP_031260397.1 ABC transporter B family member 26, chloroplastic isoform X2 [Pistacia vera]XP_031260398.1 ABC transporter B family member 26, chloroplastic isoform X3 [Pistacia vera]